MSAQKGVRSLVAGKRRLEIGHGRISDIDLRVI